MSKSKLVKIPADIYETAVMLTPKIVEQYGPPPNYKSVGPGPAIRAGIAMVEAVMNGDQRLVPAAHMAEYEAQSEALGLMHQKAALLSVLVIAACQKIADLNDDDPERRGAAIASEMIRVLVETEILEAEAVADPQTAEALRAIAQSFLRDADALAARARPIMEKVG